MVRFPEVRTPGSRSRATSKSALRNPQARDAGSESEGDAPRISDVGHRLMVGLGGIGAVILVVGVANVITDRALRNEETAVPQAAPTVEPNATEGTSDPLSDAGVVPDLPEQPEAEPVPEGPVLPETGEGNSIE